MINKNVLLGKSKLFKTLITFTYLTLLRFLRIFHEMFRGG